MTEKRFYMDKSGDLYDKKNHDLLMLDFGYSYDGVSCKKIIDLLNELSEENQHLLKHLDMVREQRDELIVKNKELKQFKQQVINLIDEKIIFVDACTQNYKLSYDYYHGAMDILELLKKECFE